MKAFQTIMLGLAGLVGTVAVAQAQEEAKGVKLDAIVQFGNKKPAKLSLDKASGKDKFLFTDAMNHQQLELPVSQCKTFLIQSPADFVQASRLYRAGKLDAAAKRLGAVKTKYKDFAGLPGNPATQAALYQCMALVRMQDWTALKSCFASFPSPNLVEDYQKPLLLALKFLAVEDAAASSSMAEIDALFEKKGVVEKFDLEVYGLIRLAQARGLVAAIPAAELESGELSEESVGLTTLAADYFCQAAMAMHGANPELVRYCMARAALLLIKMPDARKYQASLNGADECSPAQWKAAPANFKDAATLAMLAINLYPAEADAALAALAKYYVKPVATAGE